MTIKTLRKGYANLTMLQRLALADNALGRDDESEALAIKNASPRVHYTATDFSELFDEIIHFRMCNLVVRLGYILSFDMFRGLEEDYDGIDELDKSKNGSSSRALRRISSDRRLAAYLYVRATDSWNSVNSELGLRSNFEEEMGQHFLAIDLLNRRDNLMREYAFSEAEAKVYLSKSTGKSEFTTLHREIELIRDALKLNGVTNET